MKYTFYLIKQKSTEKVYVGCTTRNIPARMAEHKYNALKRNRREAIYQAIRESGWDDFEVEVLEAIQCSKRDSIIMEAQLIEYYSALDPQSGFNVQNGGNGFATRVPTEWNGVPYLSINEAARESGVPLTSLVKKLSKLNK